MGVPSTIPKMFSQFGGVDYRSHDAEKKPRFAKYVQNCEFTLSNGITARKGQKGKAPPQGGGGTKTFVFHNPETEERFEEIITIDSELWKLVSGTLSITYSGAESSVTAGLYPYDNGVSKEFRFVITEAEVEVLTVDLGTGLETAAPITIDNLAFIINQELNPTFTAVVTGDGSGPAAFSNNFVDAIGSGLDIEFNYWQQIYCPVPTPFADFLDSYTLEEFEIACLFPHANRLLIATGFNKLYKYDSVSCYAAGMPAATGYSASVIAGGAIPEPYSFSSFITYEHTDALGNFVEGNASNFANYSTSTGNQQISHTIPTLQSSSEFLTSCGIANNGGTETGTTLTVDDGGGFGGHTIQPGQTVFFYDNTGAEVIDKVVSTTFSTITLENSHTIANNEVISANLRINLWRNRAGGADPYLVKTFANNSFVTDFTFTDNVADNDLLIEYEFPIEGHGLPPERIKYLTAYQNVLIGARKVSTVVDFSDFDGPEYWNANFEIRSKSNETISGVGANKEIAVIFKPDECHMVQGDLPSTKYRVDVLSDSVGCTSHHSIVDVESTTWFWSDTGPHRIVSTSLPEDLAYRIAPAIINPAPSEATTLVAKRVIAIKVSSLQLVLFFVPTESNESGYKIPNGNSIIYAADYRSQMEQDVEYDEEGRVEGSMPKVRWLPWNNINMSGGATIYNNQLIWTARYYNDAASEFQAPLICRLENNDQYDYSDHGDVIPWSYDAGWQDLNFPDVIKKWLKAVIYSFPDGIVTGSFTIDASTEIRYINEVPHSRKTITIGEEGVSTGWGFWPWDITPWGDQVGVKSFFPFKLTESVALKLRFEALVWCFRPLISAWSFDVKGNFKTKTTVDK